MMNPVNGFSRNGVLAAFLVTAALCVNAQRVDSTLGTKLMGSPRVNEPQPPATSTSLQNSSSKSVGGWSEYMFNRPYGQTWLFNYPVISSSIDAVAGKVIVNGSVTFSYTIPVIVPTYVKLLRDGTVIQSLPISAVGAPTPSFAGPDSNQAIYSYAYGGVIPINWVDVPGPGHHTYEVQIQGGTTQYFDWTFYFYGGSLAMWQ